MATILFVNRIVLLKKRPDEAEDCGAKVQNGKKH